jgi:hypothetical protein
MLGASLSNELKYKEQAFDEKIEKIFNLAEKVLSLLFLTYSFISVFLIQ